jgi:Protein of unknown function (DUF3592)
VATTPQQRLQPGTQRSGRQLWAFGFFWLAVSLIILASWLAMKRMDRLLHWSQADAEVQRSDVYSTNPRAGAAQRNRLWRATVTIRYVANGQLVETTVDRGFESGVRSWMEHWTKQYPVALHKKILFDPASPLDADLDGDWSLATFSLPLGLIVSAVFLLWGRRLLRVAAPNNSRPAI